MMADKGIEGYTKGNGGKKMKQNYTIRFNKFCFLVHANLYRIMMG